MPQEGAPNSAPRPCCLRCPLPLLLCPRRRPMAPQVIRMWDYRFYLNRVEERFYAVDHEALRQYFPFDRVLEGMLGIYRDAFGLEFTELKGTSCWHADVMLFEVPRPPAQAAWRPRGLRARARRRSRRRVRPALASVFSPGWRRRPWRPWRKLAGARGAPRPRGGRCEASAPGLLLPRPLAPPQQVLPRGVLASAACVCHPRGAAPRGDGPRLQLPQAGPRRQAPAP